MENIIEFAVQYGIAGLALWMMYSITYNHLTNIEKLLLSIDKRLFELVNK